VGRRLIAILTFERNESRRPTPLGGDGPRYRRQVAAVRGETAGGLGNQGTIAERLAHARRKRLELILRQGDGGGEAFRKGLGRHLRDLRQLCSHRGIMQIALF
jgi:hypothetical protein